MFSAALDAGNAMQALSPTSPVRGLRWVQPGALQAMDWRIQPNQGVPDATVQAAFNAEREAYYRTFRPWPGSSDALVLTDASGQAPSGCCASELPALPWWDQTALVLLGLLVVFFMIDAITYVRYGKAGQPNSWRWEAALFAPSIGLGLVLALLLMRQELRGLDLVRGILATCMIVALLMRVVLNYRLRQFYPEAYARMHPDRTSQHE